MANDPAYYLAQRAHELYSLSPQATMQELLCIYEQRGIHLVNAPGLDRGGWYVKTDEVEAVFLRDWTPWVLAHELFHHWIAENIHHGIVYPYPDYANDDVEQAANRFAELLCGQLVELEEGEC